MVARSGRRARYWAAAGVVLLIGVIGGWLYWSAAGPRPIAQQDVTVAKDTTTTLPDATVLDPATYQIGAKFHVMKASKGTTLKAGDRVAPGDRLFVTVESSKPVHVYVINEDEHGESYLLFPLPGQNLANPLPGGLTNRLPGVDRRRGSFLEGYEHRRQGALLHIRQPHSARAVRTEPCRSLKAKTRPAVAEHPAPQERRWRPARRRRSREGRTDGDGRHHDRLLVCHAASGDSRDRARILGARDRVRQSSQVGSASLLLSHPPDSELLGFA